MKKGQLNYWRVACPAQPKYYALIALSGTSGNGTLVVRFLTTVVSSLPLLEFPWQRAGWEEKIAVKFVLRGIFAVSTLTRATVSPLLRWLGTHIVVMSG